MCMRANLHHALHKDCQATMRTQPTQSVAQCKGIPNDQLGDRSCQQDIGIFSCLASARQNLHCQMKALSTISRYSIVQNFLDKWIV